MRNVKKVVKNCLFWTEIFKPNFKTQKEGCLIYGQIHYDNDFFCNDIRWTSKKFKNLIQEFVLILFLNFEKVYDNLALDT